MMNVNHKKDDPKEYIILGSQYAIGDGVPRDIKTAVSYYRLAAENGVSFGWECIGCLLYQEAKTEDDFEEAYRYLMMADPEKRSCCTTFALAEMYRLGKVVEQDEEKAGDLYWSILEDEKNAIDDYYPRAGLRLLQMHRHGVPCLSIANRSSILHMVKDFMEKRPFDGSLIGFVEAAEFEKEWEDYLDHSGPVDHTVRWKDYTYELTLAELPVSDEQFEAIVSILQSLQTRSDVSLIIKILNHDDPQEILVAYSGTSYYCELNFPMDDFEWDHPLLLARDGLSFDEVANLLWLITVCEMDTDDISLVYYHFKQVSTVIFNGNKPGKA